MGKEQTEIIESTLSHILRIRPGKIKEYSFRERNGFLKHESGKEHNFESGELSSRKELIKTLPEHLKKSFFSPENRKSRFDKNTVAHSGDQISSFLNKIPGLEWEIVFKTLEKRKVVKRGKLVGVPDFSHFSVLIRFKKANWDSFIEIGEGNTNGSAYNVSGLVSRVKEIIRCNNEAGDRSLPEDLPLILSPGEGGIVFHEILGHSLEADHILTGLSPFTISDIGKKVVSGNITLSTFLKGDPFFENIDHDDEGVLRSKEILIERGVLRHVISDTFYSGALGIDDSGSSRMEDFTKRPIPRMFAIYLCNGGYSHNELMDSTKKGVFAREFGDGKVLFHKNRFYFNIPSAYMVRQGRIREPLGSIVVSGKINEVFNSIEMIADDFSLDRGISYCYKDGQTLNVRVGQPSVKITNLKLSRGLNDI